MPTQFKERAIAVIVNNRPDVLARIAATFSARGFNIETISANVTRNLAVTKIIVTTLTTQDTIARLVKQLNRLVDVLEVKRLRRPQALRRELVIARVQRKGENLDALQALVKARGGKMIHEETDALILEFTGDKEEMEEILARLEELGMEDFARSGAIALDRRGA